MKLKHFISILLAFGMALSLPSCVQQITQPKEEEEHGQESGEEPDPDQVVLDVSMEKNTDETGKVAFSAGTSLCWEDGDKVAVWDGYEIREFSVRISEEKTVLVGTAVKGVKYWAIYPFNSCKGVDDSNSDNPLFEVQIPGNQLLRRNSVPKDALVCSGCGTEQSGIVLKHLCGLLKFSLPAGKPGTMNRICVKSVGEKQLCGKVRISCNGDVPEYTFERSDGDSAIELGFDTIPEAGATYYLCSLPCEIGGSGKGITLDFTRTGDKAVAQISGCTDDKNKVTRAKVTDMGELLPLWRAVDDSDFDNTPDPTGVFDYSRISMTSHPRLLATDADFDALKTILAEGTYPELNRQHAATIEHAESLLSKDIPTVSELDAMIDAETGSYQNTFNEKLARPSIDHLMTCSYAYRVTGEKKYLDEVRKIVTQRCADPFWSKNPSGKSIAYISPAEITLGMAIAYDWLYYDFTEQERAAMRKAMTTKPFEIGEDRVRTYCLRDEVNNRGQVNNAGILATALALYDKNKSFSNKWMEYCDTGIRNINNGVYGTSGSTQEGYGYWEYGTGYFELFDEMLFTVFGNDNGYSSNTGFGRTGDYNLYMCDHLSSFAFSDGGRDKLSCQISPWWLALRFNRPELMLNEMYLLSIGRKLSHRIMAFVPIILAKYPKMDLTSLPHPSSDIWSDSNSSVTPVVLVRTGWSCSGADKYLGLKGGYASVSHGHMDVGTFEYHSNGVRWSVDNSVGGYARYTNKNLSSGNQTTTSGYVKWLALAYGSLGHSTISFANYDKAVGGIAKTHNTDHIVAASSKAEIIETYNTVSEKGGKIDMSKTLKGQVKSATRKAVIKDGSYLLVEDCIEALPGSDAQMIWRMITPSTVTAEIVGSKSIKLKQGGNVVYLHPEFNAAVKNLTLKNWGDFDSAHPGLTKEWGWTSIDHKVTECIKANVIGFTVTIPKGTKVTVSTTLTEHDPAASNQGGVGGETPGFNDGDVYNW